MSTALYRAALAFILVFIHSNCFAQFFQQNCVYITAGMNAGSYLGSAFHLNYINKNKTSFQLEHSLNFKKNKNIPEDYKSGLGPFVIFTTGPNDVITNYRVGIGKVLYEDTAENLRLNLQVNIGYSTLAMPTNWRKKEKSFFLESNYDYDIHTRGTVSIIIKPSMESTLNRFIGLGISPFIDINKYRTIYGANLHSMLGWVRPKKNI